MTSFEDTVGLLHTKQNQLYCSVDENIAK